MRLTGMNHSLRYAGSRKNQGPFERRTIREWDAALRRFPPAMVVTTAACGVPWSVPAEAAVLCRIGTRSSEGLAPGSCHGGNDWDFQWEGPLQVPGQVQTTMRTNRRLQQRVTSKATSLQSERRAGNTSMPVQLATW